MQVTQRVLKAALGVGGACKRKGSYSPSPKYVSAAPDSSWFGDLPGKS